MEHASKKIKLNNNESKNIYINNANNMSVHNISMNAILCTSLNLDSIYKHFSNCVYNPREFKCMRIDVPVSLNTVNKYINYIKNKEKLQTEQNNLVTENNKNEICMPVENNSNKDTFTQLSTITSNINDNINIEPDNYYSSEIKYIDEIQNFEEKNDEADYTSEKLVINVSIFSNGKIICTGNNSIEACKIAMKKVEKKLKQLNFKNIKLKKIAITNILAVYNVGFSIVLPLFAQYYKSVDYDPNVFPACKVKIALSNDDNNNSSEFNEQNDSAYAWCTNNHIIEASKNKTDVVSASIFSTGNITLTGGKSYDNLKKCIDILLPYLIRSKSQH
ncbi:transcription initiation TFIID-like, putative [Plasmodium berghei]|uniref:Transcription initiation TFIID-like, putative n=2 Tax=Plasmodium berghei TaxID=5821 RepID=A0A509AJQ0_PLABA|nr:transcription initiation TFIID-like, putative [Plasmodium berghei ANKA]CXI51657.1 transcription initiation TFIID-like, putative [Plasmodium berghei]SCL94467.1 transcription initiation TFIID-like, putative [Plasmodium berghei]SCM16033.1 transcription initiation TFIID-like, putative [Plasmodium berghei]SCM17829.1 transcription initiation TFIID-like, putative [Plasmodium berghei]SCN26100.1 transcription initiation TFIID-like, putative [Plasmodium berghei]|eukprot:XP_034421958.1 transcription initiation TFIID-like, putative [Plasmodium berghei ANKA]